MNRIIISIIIIIASCIGVKAQTLKLYKNGSIVCEYKTEEVDSIVFEEAKTTYKLSDFPDMKEELGKRYDDIYSCNGICKEFRYYCQSHNDNYNTNADNGFVTEGFDYNTCFYDYEDVCSRIEQYLAWIGSELSDIENKTYTSKDEIEQELYSIKCVIYQFKDDYIRPCQNLMGYKTSLNYESSLVTINSGTTNTCYAIDGTIEDAKTKNTPYTSPFEVSGHHIIWVVNTYNNVTYITRFEINK